jgi:four helix bundle protein
MTKEELKLRTKNFAIDSILFVNSLPKSKANDVMSYQLIKSATSVGANYRSACRGRSTAEFISKLNIVLEEVDESCYWYEILEKLNYEVNHEERKRLLNEANELTVIFASAIKTLKKEQECQKNKSEILSFKS